MTITQKIQQAENHLKELKQLNKELNADIQRKQELIRKLSRIDLTNKQAARLVGKSVGTVQRWKRKGLLKSTNALDVLEADL